MHPAQVAALWLSCLSLLGACQRTSIPSDGSSNPRAAPAASSSVRRGALPNVNLAGIERVEGHAVGEGGEPGAFYLKLVELTKTLKPEELEALTQSPSPIGRALGLAALARLRAGSARQVLERSLHDRSGIEYYPGGCVGWSTTLGAFASDLLENPDQLWPEPQSARLLEEAELDALNLELLAADDTYAFHWTVERRLEEAFKAGRLRYDLGELQRKAPKLPAWRIVLALGRLQGSDEARALLLASLPGQTALEPQVRLAAASALTRSATDAAISALDQHAAALDALGSEHWGNRLLEEAKRHRAFQRKMAPLERVKTWMGNEKLADGAVAAFDVDDAFAVDALLGEGTTSFGSHSDAVYAARDAALLRIVPRLRELPAFSTWRDVPYQLEQALLRASDLPSGLAPPTRTKLRQALKLAPVQP